jgi:hypothetical protein
MRRALAVAALVACGLITARCATEGAAGDYYDPYYYDDPWYGYGFGWGVVVGGCCGGGDGGDIGPPPRPEHPIARPPDGGDRPRPENPIANAPKPEPKSSSSRSMSSPRSAAPSRGGGFGGGGRGGGGRR